MLELDNVPRQAFAVTFSTLENMIIMAIMVLMMRMSKMSVHGAPCCPCQTNCNFLPGTGRLPLCRDEAEPTQLHYYSRPHTPHTAVNTKPLENTLSSTELIECTPFADFSESKTK